MPVNFPPPRRAAGRHPLVYLAAFCLMFSVVALFARAGFAYVAGGTIAAILLAAGAIAVALSGRS